MPKPRPQREMPPKLGRRRATIQPKFKIVAVCEGKNTEPLYLRQFCEDVGNGLVHIHTIRGAGVAQTVVDESLRLLRQMRSRRNNSFERYDQCWAVFDHDGHPNVEQCVLNARKAGIFVAFSNPCIELWALLHIGDYAKPSAGSHLQSTLKDLMPTYDPKGSKIFDYDLMRIAYPEAVRRAKHLLQEMEKVGSPLGNPHTDIFKLTETIKNNANIIGTSAN